MKLDLHSLLFLQSYSSGAIQALHEVPMMYEFLRGAQDGFLKIHIHSFIHSFIAHSLMSIHSR